MLAGFIEPDLKQVAAIGAVIPHAGYMYSGHVAGAVFSRLLLPARTIILCPNHTGYGPPLSIMNSGVWEMPFGPVEIDEELSAALIGIDPELRDDTLAHRHEHAVEVMLPFIQQLAGTASRFVPIVVGTGNFGALERLGHALANVIRTADPKPLIIASSDMNHYEAGDITRIKDHKAIECILALDARGLHDTVQRENISMCGCGPATAMLVAAKELGAGSADLVRYATSGDVSGDFDRVVGYAGVIVQ